MLPSSSSASALPDSDLHRNPILLEPSPWGDSVEVKPSPALIKGLSSLHSTSRREQQEDAARAARARGDEEEEDDDDDDDDDVGFDAYNEGGDHMEDGGYELEEYGSAPHAHKTRSRHQSMVGTVPQSTRNHAVQFRWRVFVGELLLHLLVPLSVLVSVLCTGPYRAWNQLFLSPRAFAFQYGPSAVFVALIVLLGSVPDEDFHTIQAEALVAVMLHVIHKFMVATKYAFMPPALYRKWGREPVAYRTQRRLELVSGWNEPTCETSGIELDASANRLGVHLKDVHFHVALTPEEIRAMLRKPDYEVLTSEHGEDLNQICSHALSTHMVALANDVMKQRTAVDPARNSFMWHGLTLGVLPMLLRAFKSESVLAGSHTSSNVVVVLSFLLTVFYFQVIVRFFIVGRRDYERRYLLLSMLTRTIKRENMYHARRSTVGSGEQRRRHAFRHLPPIDMSVKANILSWLILRNVIEGFGLMYRKRVHLYVAYGVFAVLVLVATLAADFFQDQISGTTVVTILYLTLTLAYYLVQTFLFGGKVANMHRTHKETVVRTQFAIRETITGAASDFAPQDLADKDDTAGLHGCDLLLDSVIKVMAIEESYAERTVLGLGAGGLLRAVGALATAAIGLAGRTLVASEIS